VGSTLAVLSAVAALTVGGSGGLIVGPGPVTRAVDRGIYHLELGIAPNKGGLIRNEFTVRVTRAGRPVHGDLLVRFTMRAMPMQSLALRLRETAPGRYEGGFKLRMIGEWEIRFHVTPKGARPFDVVLLDRVRI